MSSSRLFRAPRRESPSPRSSIPKTRFALGLFAHRFPKFETTKDIQGAFFNCSGGTLDTDTEPYCQALIADTNGIDRVQPKEQEIKIGLWSAGATLSVRLGRGLSLGFSGLYYSFSIDSTNRVYSTFDDPFGPKDPAKLDLLSTQKGDDQAFAWNGGFRWSLGSWVLAGAYRRGPSFDYTNTVTAQVAHRGECLPEPGVQRGNRALQGARHLRRRARVSPDPALDAVVPVRLRGVHGSAGAAELGSAAERRGGRWTRA